MGVSLVAIAAIVVSLGVARHRHEDRPSGKGPASERPPTAAGLDLEGIRSAGF